MVLPEPKSPIGQNMSHFSQFRMNSTKFGLKKNVGRVFKSNKELREKRQKKETLSKLKDLVPTVPSDRDISQLELLQHVLDYIYDLSETVSAPQEAQMETTGLQVDSYGQDAADSESFKLCELFNQFYQEPKNSVSSTVNHVFPAS